MRIVQLTLALAGLLLVACGADVGEHGTTLVIDEAQVTSDVLYMMPDVSQVPFSAIELEEQGIDPSAAIPVRVEVFESTAVAWFAPDGQARVGGDWIIALWSVERVPVSDETASGIAPDVRRPDETIETAEPNADSRPGYDIQLDQVPEHAGAVAIIDFLDRLGTPAELDLVEELISYHPGCLGE